MDFNQHLDLIGQHAFLGASKHYWTNYDEEKLAVSYAKSLAIERGIKLHEFARSCINLKIKLPKSRLALNMYVNDGIGFRMRTEQPVFYSENAFGTVDTISFRDNFLRIHDLKTGVTPVSMRQLEVYCSFFCLEYKIDPKLIDIELRIYQGTDIVSYAPDVSDILEIMEKTRLFDKKIQKMKLETED